MSAGVKRKVEGVGIYEGREAVEKAVSGERAKDLPLGLVGCGANSTRCWLAQWEGSVVGRF